MEERVKALEEQVEELRREQTLYNDIIGLLTLFLKEQGLFKGLEDYLDKVLPGANQH